MNVTERVGGWLADRTSRRSFLARTTLTATALTVAPAELLLRPVTAYAAVCACGLGSCNCGQLCCDGFTQFCCTITGGVNACPPGSFAGGWWKADGSAYCAGPRYYIDCQGECHGCGCPGGGSFCPGCDGLTCECALGDCNNRVVGCNEFRYGQCHQEIACSGRILCRVVTCTPPWMIDPTCTTVSQTDESTANHFAPCQGGPTSFGPPPAVVVGMAASRTGHGYWVVDSAGAVFNYGDAQAYGSMAGKPLTRPVVGMAVTKTGAGYWLVASDGGIFAFGDATFDGSEGGKPLNRPIVGLATDPATGGYWMVASDGGIFSFDSPFDGSEGNKPLNKPIVGMAPTPTGRGYWMVASDGGIFTFGDAVFRGSEGAKPLNQPIVGMAATPTGQGYWMVAADGGIFTFGDAVFYGARPPAPA